MVKTVPVFSPRTRPEGRARQLLQFADAGIDAFRDGCRFQALAEFRHNHAADRLRVHGLGEGLHGNQIVVTVHDQPGKKVGFAEDHAIGIAIAHDPFPITDGFLNAFPEQAAEVIDGVGRNQADGDLGGAAVEGCAQEFPALVGDAHRGPRRDPVRGDDIRAIDPDVAVLQTFGAAAGDFYYRKRRNR